MMNRYWQAQDDDGRESNKKAVRQIKMTEAVLVQNEVKKNVREHKGAIAEPIVMQVLRLCRLHVQVVTILPHLKWERDLIAISLTWKSQCSHHAKWKSREQKKIAPSKKI